MRLKESTMNAFCLSTLASFFEQQASIALHRHMGFSAKDSKQIIDAVPVFEAYTHMEKNMTRIEFSDY
jgi:hypothetical protein